MPDPITPGHTPAASGKPPDDRQLIEKAREGDRNAFRCLVERHMRHAYNLAYSFSNDHHSAEEVAQEAFVRIYQSLGAFRGDAEFGTWLYRIVANLSLNRVKQMRRLREREVRTTDQLQGPYDASSSAQSRDMREHIERALHELPTMQRAVLILRHIDGLSTNQVSRILNCSEGTVKTHLFRGLEKMKLALGHLKEES